MDPVTITNPSQFIMDTSVLITSFGASHFLIGMLVGFFMFAALGLLAYSFFHLLPDTINTALLCVHRRLPNRRADKARSTFQASNQEQMPPTTFSTLKDAKIAGLTVLGLENQDILSGSPGKWDVLYSQPTERLVDIIHEIAELRLDAELRQNNAKRDISRLSDAYKQIKRVIAQRLRKTQ